MIPISYLYEQQPQEEVPPELQGSLADRIFARAVERVPNPEVDEETAIEDEVAQKIEGEKYAAKVGARVAEERNRDPELKQLKAAEAIHNKETADDTKALETGVVPEKVAKDKIEKEVIKQQEAEAAAAAEQAPPEGNGRGQVAEGKIQDYI